MNKYNVTSKQRTRIRLVQALYRFQAGHESIKEIEYDYLSKSKKQDNISKSYFKTLFAEIASNSEALAAKLKPYSDRDAAELGMVECAILWLASYELMYQIQVPPKVVINEAIELAKAYGGQDSYKYINRVLDNFYQDLSKEKS